MTSLLREDTPVPIAAAASATITSCPAIAAARATASPTTPDPTTRTCIRPPPPRLDLDRQPGIVLRQRTLSCFRAGHSRARRAGACDRRRCGWDRDETA